jgi:hypothetical protein
MVLILKGGFNLVCRWRGQRDLGHIFDVFYRASLHPGLGDGVVGDARRQAVCQLHKSRMIRAVTLLAVLALSVPVVAAPPDGADPNSPLGNWYRSLKVPGTGQSCCNVTDCRPVDSAWIEGDRWHARIGDRVIDIPANRVLRRENPDGRGILCRSVWAVLCFVPPSGT